MTLSTTLGLRRTRSSEERDRELLQRIALADREAMRELYLSYHRRLSRFLTRLTPRQELIEEMINDTLTIVWQQADRFRADSRVSTWIMGIAYRHGLKLLRAESRATRILEAQPAVTEETGDTLLEEAERADMVRRAMATLSLEHQAVLAFTYVLGFSCEETARAMDCPVNTVKTRMFYARQRMREALPQDPEA